MKKVVFALLALAGLAAPVLAQKSVYVPLVTDYDLASTSFIACYTTGEADEILSSWRPVLTKIKTTGSSTTVVSNTASAGAFTNVSVGDELLVNYGNVGTLASGAAITTVKGAETRVVVTARASADSITVNNAVDFSAGYPFYFRKSVCSTAASAGWIGVQGFKSVGWHFQVTSMSATSIDMKVECRVQGATNIIVNVWDENYTAAGSTSASISGDLHYDACRMVLKVNTDTGTQSVTGAMTSDK